VPTAWVIEKNPTNVLKVYKDTLQYYKKYEEKKHPDSKWSGDDEVSSKAARKEDKYAPTEKGDATVQEVFEIYQNTTPRLVEGQAT